MPTRPGAPDSPALPPEELSWETPVCLHGESRAAAERGFALRLHAQADCPERLGEGELVARRVERAKVDTLCPACTEGPVGQARSNLLRHLRDAERTLERMLAGRGEGSPARQTALCHTLRRQAEEVVSVSPAVRGLADEVVALALRVLSALRERLRAAAVRAADAAWAEAAPVQEEGVSALVLMRLQEQIVQVRRESATG